MFDVIRNIIGHDWTSGGGDQQYIYFISGACILVFVCVFTDLIFRIFRGFCRMR